MEEKKKKKRYLWDILQGISVRVQNILFWSILIIGTIMFRNVHTPVYAILEKEPLTVVSEEERKEIYNQLHEIADMIVKEDEYIDVKLIPIDVHYSITTEGDDIIFEYSLDKTDANFFTMRVTLSKELKVIKKECNLESASQSEFERRMNMRSAMLKCVLSFWWTAFLYLCLMALVGIVSGISYLHKKSDERKEANKED